MNVTTKDLRLNLACILSQVSDGKSVNINYGRGKNKQVFELISKIPADSKQGKITKLFSRIEQTKLSDSALKIQKLSQKDFQKEIKNMYEDK